ncbi:hypothetical protein G7Y89_g7621 [Cudoniella acicularis]|uniref:Uncharacterized protein n=1 Tax=Cudoniella acicularis TaxID=354080 RepID=A0A8H4W3M1_9HELO|nr:hypothetical protein G7Y89_g7621 [Cudoniella acicularis]
MSAPAPETPLSWAAKRYRAGICSSVPSNDLEKYGPLALQPPAKKSRLSEHQPTAFYVIGHYPVHKTIPIKAKIGPNGFIFLDTVKEKSISQFWLNEWEKLEQTERLNRLIMSPICFPENTVEELAALTAEQRKQLILDFLKRQEALQPNNPEDHGSFSQNIEPDNNAFGDSQNRTTRDKPSEKNTPIFENREDPLKSKKRRHDEVKDSSDDEEPTIKDREWAVSAREANVKLVQERMEKEVVEIADHYKNIKIHRDNLNKREMTLDNRQQELDEGAKVLQGQREALKKGHEKEIEAVKQKAAIEYADLKERVERLEQSAGAMAKQLQTSAQEAQEVINRKNEKIKDLEDRLKGRDKEMRDLRVELVNLVEKIDLKY